MSPGLFRFFLACVVVVHHYSRIAIGTAAVFLFFALSGYWIAVMWQSKYSRAHQPYLTFLVSRYWRLWPVFIVCSAIALVISGIPLSVRGRIAALSMLGYSQLSDAPLYPAWSLDVEMQFYVLAPLLITATQSRPVLVAACAIPLAALAGYFAGSFNVLVALPFFLAGVVSAQHRFMNQTLATFSAVCAVGMLLAFSATPALRPVLLVGAHPLPGAEWNWLLNSCVAVAALPFALNTVRYKPVRHDQLLSDWSFSLYLLHVLPLYALRVVAPSGTNRLVATAAMLAISLAGSLALTLWLDRPINAMRAAFVRERMARPPSP